MANIGAGKPFCGARTRNGAACKRKGSGKGGRCRNHGGCSTGPRTDEGRLRIADAQRRRWARIRAEPLERVRINRVGLA